MLPSLQPSLRKQSVFSSAAQSVLGVSATSPLRSESSSASNVSGDTPRINPYLGFLRPPSPLTKHAAYSTSVALTVAPHTPDSRQQFSGSDSQEPSRRPSVRLEPMEDPHQPQTPTKAVVSVIVSPSDLTPLQPREPVLDNLQEPSLDQPPSVEQRNPATGPDEAAAHAPVDLDDADAYVNELLDDPELKTITKLDFLADEAGTYRPDSASDGGADFAELDPARYRPGQQQRSKVPGLRVTLRKEALSISDAEGFIAALERAVGAVLETTTETCRVLVVRDAGRRRVEAEMVVEDGVGVRLGTLQSAKAARMVTRRWIQSGEKMQLMDAGRQCMVEVLGAEEREVEWQAAEGPGGGFRANNGSFVGQATRRALRRYPWEVGMWVILDGGAGAMERVAGGCNGVGTVVRVMRRKGTEEREVEVVWEETGLRSGHWPEAEGGAGKGREWVRSTRELLPFEWVVGVHVRAEVGLRVERRRLPTGEGGAEEVGTVLAMDGASKCVVLWEGRGGERAESVERERLRGARRRSRWMEVLLREGQGRVGWVETQGRESGAVAAAGLRVEVGARALREDKEWLEEVGEGVGVVVGAEREGGGETGQVLRVAVRWRGGGQCVLGAGELGRGGVVVAAAPAELVVGGRGRRARVGMRVRLRDWVALTLPGVLGDSGGGSGTVSWVDPWEGGGQAGGGTCEVVWEWTGKREVYKAGFHGESYLREVEEEREVLVGKELKAEAGLRVRLTRAVRDLFPLVARAGGEGEAGKVTRVLALEKSAVGRVLLRRAGEDAMRAAGKEVEELVGVEGHEAEEGMRVRLSGEGQGVPRLVAEAGREGQGRGTVVRVGGGGVCGVLWDETGREGECKVGKGGATWLAVEKDEELVGSGGCPAVVGLRVCYARKVLEQMGAEAAAEGDGPGTIVSVNTELQQGMWRGRGRRAGGGKGEEAAGECVVRWDATEKESTCRVGEGGVFTLARWVEEWEAPMGTVAEVQWEGGRTQVVEVKEGYAYRRARWGAETLGGGARFLPLALANEGGGVRELVGEMVEAAAGEVERRAAARARAAEMMQSLFRGVWGRRRARWVSKVAACRLALQHLLAPLPASRQGSRVAFPPGTAQAQLLGMTVRFGELQGTPLWQRLAGRWMEAQGPGQLPWEAKGAGAAAGEVGRVVEGAVEVLRSAEATAEEKQGAVEELWWAGTDEGGGAGEEGAAAVAAAGGVWELVVLMLGWRGEGAGEGGGRGGAGADGAEAEGRVEERSVEVQVGAVLALGALAWRSPQLAWEALRCGALQVAALLLSALLPGLALDHSGLPAAASRGVERAGSGGSGGGSEAAVAGLQRREGLRGELVRGCLLLANNLAGACPPAAAAMALACPAPLLAALQLLSPRAEEPATPREEGGEGAEGGEGVLEEEASVRLLLVAGWASPWTAMLVARVGGSETLVKVFRRARQGGDGVEVRGMGVEGAGWAQAAAVASGGLWSGAEGEGGADRGLVQALLGMGRECVSMVEGAAGEEGRGEGGRVKRRESAWEGLMGSRPWSRESSLSRGATAQRREGGGGSVKEVGVDGVGGLEGAVWALWNLSRGRGWKAVLEEEGMLEVVGGLLQALKQEREGGRGGRTEGRQLERMLVEALWSLALDWDAEIAEAAAAEGGEAREEEQVEAAVAAVVRKESLRAMEGDARLRAALEALAQEGERERLAGEGEREEREGQRRERRGRGSWATLRGREGAAAEGAAEREWGLGEMAQGLLWQAQELAGEGGGAARRLRGLEGREHILVAAGTEAETTLAGEVRELLEREDYEVWGERGKHRAPFQRRGSVESREGREEEERLVDEENRVIALPRWVTRGVGGSGGVVAVWGAGAGREVRWAVEVAYARMLRKPLVLLQGGGLEKGAEGVQGRGGEEVEVGGARVVRAREGTPQQKARWEREVVEGLGRCGRRARMVRLELSRGEGESGFMGEEDKELRSELAVLAGLGNEEMAVLRVREGARELVVAMVGMTAGAWGLALERLEGGLEETGGWIGSRWKVERVGCLSEAEEAVEGDLLRAKEEAEAEVRGRAAREREGAARELGAAMAGSMLEEAVQRACGRLGVRWRAAGLPPRSILVLEKEAGEGQLATVEAPLGELTWGGVQEEMQRRFQRRVGFEYRLTSGEFVVVQGEAGMEAFVAAAERGEVEGGERDVDTTVRVKALWLEGGEEKRDCREAPQRVGGRSLVKAVADGEKEAQALLALLRDAELGVPAEGKLPPSRVKALRERLEKGGEGLLHDLVGGERGRERSVWTASSYGREHGPGLVADGREETRWASDGEGVGAWIEVDLGRECVLAALRVRQSPEKAGGGLGEHVTLLLAQFSGDAWRDLALRGEEEGVQEVWLGGVRTSRLRLTVKESYGQAGLGGLELMGYEADQAQVLVRPGEKVGVGVAACRAGGAVWVAEGTYRESVEVRKPLAILALGPAPPTIVSPEPALPALAVEGVAEGAVRVHRVSLLQVSGAGCGAEEGFKLDRLAPGLLGRHWDKTETVQTDFGAYERGVTEAGDEGAELPVELRVKTVDGREAAAKTVELAGRYPEAMAEVAALEARWQERAGWVEPLKERSKSMKEEKRGAREAAEEYEGEVEAAAEAAAVADSKRGREVERRRAEAEELRRKMEVWQERAEAEAERLRVMEERLAAEEEAARQDEAAERARMQQVVESVLPEKHRLEMELLKEEEEEELRADFEALRERVLDTIDDIQWGDFPALKQRPGTRGEPGQEMAPWEVAVRAREDGNWEEAVRERVAGEYKRRRAEARRRHRWQEEEVVRRMEAELVETQSAGKVQVLLAAKARDQARAAAAAEARQLQAARETWEAGWREEAEAAAEQELEHILEKAILAVGEEARLRELRERAGQLRADRKAVKAEILRREEEAREAKEEAGQRREEVDALRVQVEGGAVVVHGAWLNLSQCRVRAAGGHGVVVGPGGVMTMEGARVEECGQYGMLLHNGGVAVVGDSTVKGCWGDGVRVANVGGSGEWRVPMVVGRGLTVLNNMQCGVAVSAGGRVALEGGGLLANRREGLMADGEGTRVELQGTVVGQNGGGGVRVMDLAWGRVEGCDVVGSGGVGLRVTGQHTEMAVEGGAVRLSGREGWLVEGGARMRVEGAAVERNGNGEEIRQVRVRGEGSRVDGVDLRVGKAGEEAELEVGCEAGGKAELAWRTRAEVALDWEARERKGWDGGEFVEGRRHQVYRREGRKVVVDEEGARPEGELAVEVECHESSQLGAAVFARGLWRPRREECNHTALGGWVRGLHAELLERLRREAAGAGAGGKEAGKRAEREGQRGLPGGWHVYWTDKESADETIGHEGDLHGPVGPGGILDVLGRTAKLHLFPDDGARAEQQVARQRAEARGQQKLEAAARQRQREQASALARMEPEERREAEEALAARGRLHGGHVRLLRQIKADREHPPPLPRGGSSGALQPLPPKTQVIQREEWMEMTEERSGDTYWWLPATGEVTWTPPQPQRTSSLRALQPLPPVLASSPSTAASGTPVEALTERAEGGGMERGQVTHSRAAAEVGGEVGGEAAGGVPSFHS